MLLGKEPSSETVYFFLIQASGASGAPLPRAWNLVVEIKPDTDSAYFPMKTIVQILNRIAQKLGIAQLVLHVRI